MNIVRAIVRAYDNATRTATVEPTSSRATALPNVPVLRPAATTVNIAVGNTVLVAILDDGSTYVMATIDGAGPDADTVDGYHAKTSGADAHVIATDASGNATISGGLNVGTATGAGPGEIKASGAVSGTALYFGSNDYIDEHTLRILAGGAAQTLDIACPGNSYLLQVSTGMYVGNAARYYHMGVGYGRAGTAASVATLHNDAPGTPGVALSVIDTGIRVTYTGHATQFVDFATVFVLVTR